MVSMPRIRRPEPEEMMASAQIRLETPFREAVARDMRAGERVLITGTLFTGRDAAHRRLCELLERGAPLPLSLADAILFYVGPTPAPPGRPLGAAGPTTAGRMDAYAPRLIAECGLRGMIGKGARDAAVRLACVTYGAVYFGAIGGLGALLGQCVTTAEIVAYPDLGPEAIYRMTVRDFPVLVINDTLGHDAYEEGRTRYAVSAI
jgi:fumarate hydratase subunit beta